MPAIVNLTPTRDDYIALRKEVFDDNGELTIVELQFADRLPVSLLAPIVAMQRSDGTLDLTTQENVSILFNIICRLIRRSNPGWTDEDVADFIDIQDMPAIVQQLLNPQEPSSETPVVSTPVRAARATPKRTR